MTDAHWYELRGDGVSAPVVMLAREREGWYPDRWREHLLYLAGRCEEDHPQRAAELRHAAELMVQ